MSDENRGGFTRRDLVRGSLRRSDRGDASPLKARAAETTTIGPGPAPVELEVNGVAHLLTVEPRVTLADALRDRIGLTGTKVVCGRGACGACTVLMDGKTVCSCLVLAQEASGKSITTIEGLAADGKLTPLQEAFIAADALQCGFCTSGMILSAKALLDREPKPTRKAIREAVSGNLCRCGTYNHVFEAVERAAGLKTAGGRRAADPRRLRVHASRLTVRGRSPRRSRPSRGAWRRRSWHDRQDPCRIRRQLRGQRGRRRRRRPGAVGSLPEVFDRRDARAAPRRQGQDHGRGAVLDRRPPSRDAVRPDPALSPGGRDGHLGGRGGREEDAGRARGPRDRREGREDPLRRPGDRRGRGRDTGAGVRCASAPSRWPTTPRAFVVGIEAARKDGAPLVFDGQVETKTSGGDVESKAKGLARKGNVLGPRATNKGNVEEGFRKADAGRRGRRT